MGIFEHTHLFFFSFSDNIVQIIQQAASDIFIVFFYDYLFMIILVFFIRAHSSSDSFYPGNVNKYGKSLEVNS